MRINVFQRFHKPKGCERNRKAPQIAPNTMATVFLKGKTWIAQWYRADGNRVKRSTGEAKRKPAEQRAAEFEVHDRAEQAKTAGAPLGIRKIIDEAAAAAAKGKLTTARAEDLITELRQLSDPAFKRVSLADHLIAWSGAQAGRVAKSTAAGFEDMRRHFMAAFPDRVAKAPVGELTPSQVETALAKIVTLKVRGSDRTIRAATANLDLRALRRALAAAVRDKLAVSNAAAEVRPLPETDSVERAPFTAAEVRALLDHKETPEEWRGVILLAAHSGLRLGDVVALGRQHVDGTRLVVRPRKTKRTTGKTVSVPLTPPCLAWIGEKPGHFFPKLRAAGAGTLSTIFRRIMKRAGVAATVELPGGITASRSFHSLRHSFASWLAEGDIHSDVRQKLTGHSSAGMHAKYTHHDAALDRAITVLPDFGRAGG